MGQNRRHQRGGGIDLKRRVARRTHKEWSRAFRNVTMICADPKRLRKIEIEYPCGWQALQQKKRCDRMPKLLDAVGLAASAPPFPGFVKCWHLGILTCAMDQGMATTRPTFFVTAAAECRPLPTRLRYVKIGWGPSCRAGNACGPMAHCQFSLHPIFAKRQQPGAGLHPK